MQPVAEAAAALDGLGYERVKVHHGSTYRDTSTVIVCPTRGMIHHRVVNSWQGLIAPMNQKKAFLFAPADAHIRLLESIEAGPFDAVGGLYWTKGDFNMPMAYGDPAEYQRTGVLDFRPRDVRACLAAGQVMEVNGIAMGCTLYRMSLFRELAAPWFVTVADVVPDKGPQAFTQDLYFCERAKRAGKRFAVDMRVRVGHIDTNDGRVY